ncbi:Acetyl-CoA acetyltransferase [Roseivivax sp. THAF40]|uniref:acetyl-CoA C-acyltransferase n=1 Tax=unclassified Roseivivax TaxID=2639302 RepID=UPI0012692B70|nr:MULTISPECIES: acetyl-CoA C-acyltransferase [unclassified Roseivivax]QFS81735.1 Acetyl-CoA acetyltransferase [Roseivivax sp. THAF197b]QFT45535.1 Acetyl-CoA acetyltransferase [Roseivivax sp. THAF40]
MPKDITSDPVMICAATRSPLGAFQGAFTGVPATELGAAAIRGALAQAGLSGEDVDEVLMGNVLPAGLGQAPARQASLGAGLPVSVPCTTVSKVCGSGMKAVMQAHDAIAAGTIGVAVAGGMESMTGAPYLLPQGRAGARIGHARVLDHMMLDGLEDAYDIAPDGTRRSMGTFGEDCAEAFQFTRDDQDAYAIESVTRAKRAAESGAFDWEVTPVEVKTRKGAVEVTRDEGPQNIDPEKIPNLRPAFKKDGTITAASSSSINDGAAALVLARASEAERLGLTPIARIMGHSAYAGAPGWFTTAPIYAKQRLFEALGWGVDDVDLFEINEAFAVVAMASAKELRIPREKLNVHGGAVALGHPIGASGARILVTLLGAMRAQGARRGVASICIGGGEATAIGVEMEG